MERKREILQASCFEVYELATEVREFGELRLATC